MSSRTITTQSGLDQALADGVDYIDIRSPVGVWIEVADSGSATVSAHGSATVWAYGSATVRAYGSATVWARGSATVRAYGSATVRAYGSATVWARGSATVWAFGSATVRAFGSATVQASDSAKVSAHGSATVWARGSATVRAFGSATVRAFGSATVRASDSVTVQASDHLQEPSDDRAGPAGTGAAMTAATMPTPLEMALTDLHPSRYHARRWREAQSPPHDRPWVFKGRSGKWIISGSKYWGGELETVFPSFAEAIAHAHAEAVRHG